MRKDKTAARSRLILEVLESGLHYGAKSSKKHTRYPCGVPSGGRPVAFIVICIFDKSRVAAACRTAQLLCRCLPKYSPL